MECFLDAFFREEKKKTNNSKKYAGMACVQNMVPLPLQSLISTFVFVIHEFFPQLSFCSLQTLFLCLSVHLVHSSLHRQCISAAVAARNSSQFRVSSWLHGNGITEYIDQCLQ